MKPTKYNDQSVCSFDCLHGGPILLPYYLQCSEYDNYNNNNNSNDNNDGMKPTKYNDQSVCSFDCLPGGPILFYTLLLLFLQYSETIQMLVLEEH